MPCMGVTAASLDGVRQVLSTGLELGVIVAGLPRTYQALGALTYLQ
jgi:hypothetical protein